MDSQEYKDRPSLEHESCFHDARYSIEVQVPSLFQDNTFSWVRIVNGIDKYVTESMPNAKEEDIASEKPIAKARPRQKPHSNVDFSFYSCSWKEVGRYWNTMITSS